MNASGLEGVGGERMETDVYGDDDRDVDGDGDLAAGGARGTDGDGGLAA